MYDCHSFQSSTNQQNNNVQVVAISMAIIPLLFALLSSIVESQQLIKHTSKFINNNDVHGKQWAVLVAGSRGYANYRHQADVCHAYQTLRKGGLKDENIIVFMYDDIAFHVDNPRPGIIINNPRGNNVYDGVPKDYTGDNCTAHNLYAVLVGNKTAITGGSGKVVDSGPEDHIFIFYSDHGSPGVVGMPSGEDVYAKDLIDVLKKKHASQTYKSIAFYLEACQSGSMFEGLLGSNLSIYAVTAANAEENSYATYCPDDYTFPSEYHTCLGDLFSVSWMEDSDVHDLRKETLLEQYQVVRRRTAGDNSALGSHVMQYGDLKLSESPVSVYLGSNPHNDNYTSTTPYSSPTITTPLDQRDASFLYFRQKYERAPKGSNEKAEAKKELHNVISHRRHVDRSINQIAKILFGEKMSSTVLTFVRPSAQLLVDDWNCLKTLVKVYEKQCGTLSWYGKKYTRAIANMCNAGITVDQMIKASTQACL